MYKKIRQSSIDIISKIPKNESITIFWFRRDLRLEDNHGLYCALKNHTAVLPLFIFDQNILSNLQNPLDARVNFIYSQIQQLKTDLEKIKSTLYVVYGQPKDIFIALSRRYKIKAVYTNHDYEPYARQRDQAIKKYFAEKNIPFLTYKDQVIFEKNEILKEDQTPYTIFTPYSKKWQQKLITDDWTCYPTLRYLKHCIKIPPLPLCPIEQIGFQKNNTHTIAQKKIDLSIVKNYAQQRNLPAVLGTSLLGVHLRFGTISIRKITQLALKNSTVFLNQLIWRDFFMMILWHFPHVVNNAFKAKYDKIQWENNEDYFQAWCQGKTGYPIVDAGMNQLNQTGYMHNRVRMITASFLTKHLLIDWRWGEKYFAEKLLDYELASNNGGWQWAAGSGCDAAPYFRIFNPYLQTKKFDPQEKYIQMWCPNYKTKEYSKPIVEHKQARNRALNTYKNALKEIQI